MKSTEGLVQPMGGPVATWRRPSRSVPSSRFSLPLSQAHCRSPPRSMVLHFHIHTELRSWFLLSSRCGGVAKWLWRRWYWPTFIQQP